MPNWGSIGSGAAFQSLVNTLLLFDNPTNRVFGRPGPDGGLDARSQNGDTIWQAKYHQDPGIDKTLSDATNELTKITRYRDPGHPRYPLWQAARTWVLVTNLRLNANDHRRWETEVVPLFQPLGLLPEIWGEERLEALLTAHPHVERSYFGGTNRCFLSLGEAYESLDQEGPRQHGLEVPIIGRNDDLQRLVQFTEGSKKIICIHGVGGVGKSRLLFEIGSRLSEQGSRQILWGNVESMAQSAEWFASISPEQPTLLLLDEPTDERLIGVLAEQLRGTNGRMSQWKVIVAMRSPKDPILKAYRRLPITVRDDFHALTSPSADDANLIGRALLDQGPLAAHSGDDKARAVRHIVRISAGIPIWITLAIKVLESTNSLLSLPSDVADIARTYLEEVIEHQPAAIASKRQITALIRWLAIYRRVNVQDEPLIEFLVKITQFANKTELMQALVSLVQRRFVVNRGIQNRLYEIKPDVMSDYVLSDWLSSDSLPDGQASHEAAEVVRVVMEGFEGKPLPKVEELLHTLAMVEVKAKLHGQSLKLLDPLVAALKSEATTQPINHLQVIVQLLESISFARVSDTVDILRAIRLHPQPPVQIETIFGSRTLTHDDVVKSLSWTLFVGGQYAQNDGECKAVLEEMSALFLAESGLHDLPQNDGKRSKDLIPRLISGGPGYLSSYASDAYSIALQKLHEIRDGALPTDAQLSLCKTFVEFFVTVERSHTSFSDHQFTVSSWVIDLAGSEGARRSELRTLLREMTQLPSEVLANFAWSLLSASHMSAGRGQGKNPTQYRADIQNDLQWVKGRIETPGTTLATLKRARSLWHWHAEYDQDQELKSLATDCERVYQGDAQVREFDVFFNFERHEEVEQASREVGARLATQSSEQILQFIGEAEAFACAEAHWGDLFRTTVPVAEAWEVNAAIPEFVRSAFQRPSQEKVFDYAAAVFERRLSFLRAIGSLDVLARELDEYFQLAPNPTDKLQLLLALYFRPHPLISGLLTSTDFEFFVRGLDLFPPDRRWQMFRCLGGLFYPSWTQWKAVVERLWSETPRNKLGQCFLQLFDAMFFIASFREPRLVTLSQDQFSWIMELVVDLPNLEVLQGHAAWQLEQLRNAFPFKSVAWLNDSLQLRIDRSQSDPEMKVAGMNFRLSSFAEPVTPASASDATLRNEISRLLSFNRMRGQLAYYLPEYARIIDPEGVMVPDLVVAEMHRAATHGVRDVVSWSRFAEDYPKNSEPWRRIASAASIIAATLDTEGKNHIYHHLEDSSRSSSHPAGEMNPQPGQELEQCQRELDEETDRTLLEYRRWDRDRAQAIYNHTVAQFEEEQGNHS